jgi:hypothetical protein
LAAELTKNGTLSIDYLLQHKRLEPLSGSAITELTRIVELDVTHFLEADVREEIITPILRILGYAKGSYFSVDREKKISFFDTSLFIDYNVTQWSENFWLIEAKKPEAAERNFDRKTLAQALQYAVHPEINAAVFVLCDGHKIEIYDRELSLAAPIVRVSQRELLQRFDDLRVVLEPWQSWFFQK